MYDIPSPGSPVYPVIMPNGHSC